MTLAVLVLAALAVAGWYRLVVYVARRLVMPERLSSVYWRGRTQFLTPSDAGLQFESGVIVTRDGLRLAAWFIPSVAQPAKGTLVYLHGFGGSRISTIAGSQAFCNGGYNVLTYDSRGSGDSEGKYCTYGFYEKFDVSSAVDWLELRQDGSANRVALIGKSMGGAVALQAAAVEPRVRCVIAESTFTELSAVAVDYERRELGLITPLISGAAIRLAERIAKFSARETSPLAAVRANKTPKFFIHGADDPLVSASYSKLLFDAAAGEKECWIIPGGGHSELRLVAGKEYYSRRLDFLERFLK